MINFELDRPSLRPPAPIGADRTNASLSVARMTHFETLARLLNLEGKAEAEQALERIRRLSPAEAERTGQTIASLVVRDEEFALGGRLVLTFAKKGPDRPLPWNRLTVGKPVLLSEEAAAGEDWRGIVCFRDERTLRVAFDCPPEPEQERGTFRLDAAFDEAAQRRQKAALEQAANLKRSRASQLRDVLLGEREPKLGSVEPIEPLNRNLNASQRNAVEFALAASDVAVIHGPPGTGKTTAIVELIRQAVRRGECVLACAPSNVGVDNLLERLVAAGESAVRLGHPARVSAELQGHTLDLLVENHPDIRLARKLAREARTLRERTGRWTRGKPQPGARREVRAEAARLLADARRLEADAVEKILDSADVLCATLTGLDADLLGKRTFDLVVIDEAAQATEPASWIAALRGDRIVLAGDHCQLPPTIVSAEAARGGLAVSLMERLIRDLGPGIARMLTVQYRMHEAIMEFSSEEFYGAALVADPSVAAHLLADLPGVMPNDCTSSPIEFIDTAGAGFDEEPEPDGSSRLNPREAELIVRKARALLEAGLSPRQIAVIAPYAAQVRLLRELLGDGIDVDTVDGFQGREKEAILISLVRSNAEAEIGFLGDVRRMNVALTRARRKLILVGDGATVSSHEFYRRLIESFERRGGYRTVWDVTD